MDIRLAYGKDGLNVSVPDENIAGVIHMNQMPPVENLKESILESLQKPIQSAPLSEIAQGRESAVIVISDISRPVPNKVILPVILETIEQSGIPRDKITILIATGIHRPNLGDELIELVGEDIAKNYRCENHYSEDPDATEYVGEIGDGIPIYINKHYLAADLKIATGLVEMHLMAGFSGGRKAILPGIASLETMKHLHGYRMIQKDAVCNGLLKGNPFHEGAVEVARKVGVDFIVNVTLDEERRITGVFSGDLELAHEQACELIRKSALVDIEAEADIVITNGGGYPLDKTLYQSIKGLVGALDAVKSGGTVIIATLNEEGAGSEDFEKLLRSLDNPMQYYDIVMEPDFVAKDQWMIQELVNGLHHCEVLYCTESISDDDLRAYNLKPISTVEQGIEQALARHGKDASILVLPEGPYVIPKSPNPKQNLYSWQTS